MMSDFEEKSLIGNILNDELETSSPKLMKIPLINPSDVGINNFQLEEAGQYTPNTEMAQISLDNLSDKVGKSPLGRNSDRFNAYMYWQQQHQQATSIEGDISPKMDPTIYMQQLYQEDQNDYLPGTPMNFRKQSNGKKLKNVSTSFRSEGKVGSASQIPVFPVQNNFSMSQIGPQSVIPPQINVLPPGLYQQNNVLIPQSGQWTKMDEIGEDMQLNNELDQMCGSQVLSRKIQKIYEYGRDEQKELIFNKVERSCVQYSKDIFGNYTVQRVFEKSNFQQKMRIFNKLRPQFYELSKNNFGCRVIQKILELIQGDVQLQERFLEQIRTQVKSLIYDVYGNYVILKCLDTITYQRLDFLLPAITDSINYMVQQTYGCRIIQKVMETFPPEEIQRIVHLTVRQCFLLCSSEYGNYIIQHVLKNGPPQEQLVICGLIRTNFFSMCLNKYGSNTVEKYIESANRDALKEITSLILKPSNQEPFFVTIGQHPFGNYVLKKYLIMADREILDPIIMLLRHAPIFLLKIKSSEFGQRVYQVLEKILIQQ